MSAPEPLILIHGAWQGSWVWDGFLAALSQRSGNRYEPIPVDLPGNGADGAPPGTASMATYLDHLDTLVASLDCPFTLIAHSGGGVVASALAERYPDRVRRIIYIAGMMLPSGMGFAEVVDRILPQDPTVAGITPWLDWPVKGEISVVPPEAAIAFFLQDCPPALAVPAARRFTAQGEQGRALTARLTPERYGRVPRLYVQATQDRSVTLPLQRLMCELVPGTAVRSVDTGHAPHVVAPDTLLDVILPFLDTP
ncbi:alpha/beta fold hydrolase [Acetobacter fallax]|uniref:Alpha/beta fold hydrolase n=1 Tax=Acetobacter fallax TaxID=1737473 RepID=A0ABX0K5L0_9PROT|nr:alpha/beta hydrolase [Acetobacter fallax]NHO31591.1 alpha/beta fold hydrolase [Acetobacter fallax]NHO35150.1 alpha/beta fold hydrolase [Acetobacter fallax]